MEWLDKRDKVCVIGAGSSGLAAAKNLACQGFAVDILERQDDLGGNWNYQKPHSRVYRSTHTISSKRGMEYVDYPMPRHFPDYPHHSQILQYLRSYAAHFGLEKLIHYRTGVQRVEPVQDSQCSRHAPRDEAPHAEREDYTPARYWDVLTTTGERRRYGVLVIANGHNWSPKWPEYPGRFSGQVLHSAQYKTPNVMAGQRVLVVGGGNSGCDLAVEAGLHAARAWHSTRRGYYYVPKFMFGRPTDMVMDKLLHFRLPLFLRRALGRLMLWFTVGSLKKYGLPAPDHKLLETHPIVNSLLLYHLRHGTVLPKPEIDHFEGQVVHFTDGTSEEVDLILFATGYNLDFPFLDREHLNWQDGRPRLYKNVFHPVHDNLFVLGLIQPDSGQFGLVDWQARAVTAFLEARRQGTPAAEHFRRAKRKVEENLSAGIQYKNSTRHYLEVEHFSYREGLQELVRQFTTSQARAA